MMWTGPLSNFVGVRHWNINTTTTTITLQNIFYLIKVILIDNLLIVKNQQPLNINLHWKLRTSNRKVFPTLKRTYKRCTIPSEGKSIRTFRGIKLSLISQGARMDQVPSPRPSQDSPLRMRSSVRQTLLPFLRGTGHNNCRSAAASCSNCKNFCFIFYCLFIQLISFDLQTTKRQV